MTDDAHMLKRKQIESKTTDAERWLWLMENSSRGFVVMLDNDMTYIADHASDENDWDGVTFDKSIGDFPGIIDLLSLLGINAEQV